MTTNKNESRPKSKPPPKLLSFKELAELLGVSVRFLRDCKQRGELPAPIYLGGLLRWRRDEIYAWLAADLPSKQDWEWTPTRLWSLETAVRTKALEYGRLLEEIEQGEILLAEQRSQLNRRQ